MSSIGLRQRPIKTAEPITPDIGEYGDEVDFAEDMGDGSSIQGGATQVNKTTIWDEYGRPRVVNSNTLQYHLGKLRRDPLTGKLVKVFTQQAPKKKTLVEDVDYKTCEVCGVQCMVRPESRVTEANRPMALRIEHGQHMLMLHPIAALLYVDAELRQQITAVSRPRAR